MMQPKRRSRKKSKKRSKRLKKSSVCRSSKNSRGSVFIPKDFCLSSSGFWRLCVAIGLARRRISRSDRRTDGTIAQKPFGKILLIIFIVGAVGHGVWNILRGVADVDNAGTNWRELSNGWFLSVSEFFISVWR